MHVQPLWTGLFRGDVIRLHSRLLLDGFDMDLESNKKNAYGKAVAMEN